MNSRSGSPGPTFFSKRVFFQMKRTPARTPTFGPEQIARVQDAVFALAEAHLPGTFFLLDVCLEKEAGSWFLRIYIDGRQASVSLNDCEAVSRLLDPVLDSLDLLTPLSYNLEISSPGTFRPLKTQREFDFYQGRPVRIETIAPAAPRKSKRIPVALKPEDGLLQHMDLATRQLTLKKPNQSQSIVMTLEPNQVVLLNPALHYPDDDNAPSDPVIP